MNTPDIPLRVFPWQRRQWSQLACQRTTLPHALLITGGVGVGKSVFTSMLTGSLLCEQPDTEGYGCGTCKNCLLTAAGTHPDLHVVEPADEGKPITIDQIRALSEFLSLCAHTASRKIIVIAPAEAMNINAANGLLKMLEEPPSSSLLVLICGRPGALPATVRSRCQRWEIRSPEREQALAWLRTQQELDGQEEQFLGLAGGAPLLALAMARSDYLAKRDQQLTDMLELATDPWAEPLVCAARWQKGGIDDALGWLAGFTADMIKVAMVNGSARLANPEAGLRLQGVIKRLHLKELFGFFAAVSEARKLASGPLDKLSLIEDILIRWYRMTQLSRETSHNYER